MTSRKRTQGQRLLRLIRLLERETLTSAQLAVKLDCTQQEIQRDLRLLRAEGWPIEQTKGRPMSYFFAPTKPSAISPVQAVITHAMLRLLHHHAPTPSSLYHRAALELAASLPRRLHELTKQSVGSPTGSTQRILENIATAWCWQHPIAFRYQKPHEAQPKDGIADVVFMEINRLNLDWYVFMQRRGQDVVKTFHLSRFTDAAVITTEQSPDIPFDPRTYLLDAWGIVGAAQHCELTLRFAPEAVPWVAHRRWPGQVSAMWQDSHYLLTLRAPLQFQSQLKTELPLEVLAWVRSWGPRVEVVSPQWVRDFWLAEAREVLRRYDGSSSDGSGAAY